MTYGRSGNDVQIDTQGAIPIVSMMMIFGFVVQKEILPGVWAMHAGNGNQTLSAQSDTDINFDDRTYWEGENGELGQYRIGDYNLNGDTNFNDRIQWELNNGKFTSVPRD